MAPGAGCAERTPCPHRQHSRGEDTLPVPQLRPRGLDSPGATASWRLQSPETAGASPPKLWKPHPRCHHTTARTSHDTHSPSLSLHTHAPHSLMQNTYTATLNAPLDLRWVLQVSLRPSPLLATRPPADPRVSPHPPSTSVWGSEAPSLALALSPRKETHCQLENRPVAEPQCPQTLGEGLVGGKAPTDGRAQCPGRSQNPQPPTSQPLPVSPPPPGGWPRHSPAWSGEQGQDDLRKPRLQGCLLPPLPRSTPQARPPALLPDTLRGTPPPCSHPKHVCSPVGLPLRSQRGLATSPGVSDLHPDLVPCPASPGQHPPRAQQGWVEGGRAWPWLRRHLAGETGGWSQPPSGPQPPHLSQEAGAGLGGEGTPNADSPTPPRGGPSRAPPLPPPRGRAGCLGVCGPAAVQSARGSGSSARLLVPASARR